MTDRSVTLDPLCSLYWMIQTGPAQVDILAVVVGGEQPTQTGQDDVVIIIHVAEPPSKHTQTHAHSQHCTLLQANKCSGIVINWNIFFGLFKLTVFIAFLQYRKILHPYHKIFYIASHPLLPGILKENCGGGRGLGRLQRGRRSECQEGA